MKSAYELAMERLARESGPSRSLSDDEKARIAEIERKCAARVAEVRLSMEDQLRKASTPEEYVRIQGELSDRIASLESDRDRAKNAIWESS